MDAIHQRPWLVLTIATVAMTVVTPSCDCSGDDDDDGTITEPVPLDPTDFTYLLEESPASLPLWTTPCTRRLRTWDRAPVATNPGLTLSAARGEFEPVQLALGPASGTVSVSVDPFPELGSTQRAELAEVGYEEGWSESLTPLASGATVTLDEEQPAVVWLTVRVPDDAPAGEHHTTLRLESDEHGAVDVPVTLYVFDFDLPARAHFSTQLNIDVSSLIPEGGATVDAKDLLFEHRMTPKSVAWPSGFNWGITWESGAAPCEQFNDEPDEPDEYSIGSLAPFYILGEGWNGVGFPDAMIFQFVDNNTPRPASFCGIDRGDHYGTGEYNDEWSEFLGALDTYLGDHGLADKAYYYVQNEPQDEADHTLAAYLCRLTKDAAPGLRIAISEEPKPEIAEEAGGACGYDIWIAHVRAYQQDYAWERQLAHGETVWFYSLDHDPDPYFNPTAVDADGMHARIIPWAAWGHRITGWAYYDATRFFDGPRPGVRAELLREGFEDYEYLWLANGGAHPTPEQEAVADPTALSVASSMTSWTRDPDALTALRHELGRFIEGSRDTLPVLESTTEGHPRDAYYLNFQDPAGSPAADPLDVDGHSWVKVGWSAYDADAGMGWYGEYVDDPGITRYGYDDVSGYTEVERSYLYDDYGRDNLFEFALENGLYLVTLGVGRPAHGYPGDPHNATVEGIVLVDDEITTDAEPTLVRNVEVDLTDGLLSVEVGGLSESSGNWAYTFVAFLAVEPI